MLKFLRKKDSYFVKILLGTLVAIFVIAFGWDTMRSMGVSRPEAAAEVNGVPINPQKVAFLTENKLEELRQQFKDEPIPENLSDMLRQNMVATLIHTELLNQETAKMGFFTSDEELRNYIQENPQFKRDDKFDSSFYLDRFSPWYQQTRGVSFESDMRRELALDKILEEFNKLIKPSEDALKRAYELENTTYKFSVVKIRVKPENLDDVLPKDLEASKTTSETGAVAQKALADQIYSAWKSSGDIEKLLKDKNLKSRETQAMNATQLSTVFDGKDDIPAIQKLLKLRQETPFPETYFNEGSYYYLVKLIEYKHSGTPTDEDLKTFEAAYKEELSNALQTAWIKDAKAKAKIIYGN